MRFSVIIPAYNEEQNIAAVNNLLSGIPQSGARLGSL